jgi:pimeloyl-ACP methyl ester carboxylesterase
VLLGHSRGGNQTAWFAAERDDAAIKKVVLVAPQVWSEEKNSKGYQKSYNKPLAPVLAKAQKLVDAGKGDTMLKPVDFIYCPESSASAAAFVSYYTPDWQ